VRTDGHRGAQSVTSFREWTVEMIEWQVDGSDGTRYALLEGRRDRAGETFVYAFQMPAGFRDPPHWHTSDAHVVVLDGTLLLGYGDTGDPTSLELFPQGSELLVPAGARHYDGSDQETVIVGRATGVWSTHYVDARHGGSAGTVL
jgi:hypothetical protein